MNNIDTSKIENDIVRAFNAISINCLMNNYALENVVLGLIDTSEIIPIEQYANDLHIQNLHQYRQHLEGYYIDEHERIINQNRDRLIFNFYLNHIQNIFEKNMEARYENDDSCLLPCNERLRNYLLNAFPIFLQIMNTNVEYDFYDIIPHITDAEAYENHLKLTKFITAIKLKGLRRGNSVNRYVKEIQYIPFTVNKLIKKVHNRYILIKDSESIEYKIALFSIFPFLNDRHNQIFELKIKRWYELNKKR